MQFGLKFRLCPNHEKADAFADSIFHWVGGVGGGSSFLAGYPHLSAGLVAFAFLVKGFVAFTAEDNAK